MTLLRAAVAFATAGMLTACTAQGTSPVPAFPSAQSTRNLVGNATQQSVAYQINPEHTGFAAGPMKTPLKKLWSVKLGDGHGVYDYPLVANGVVVANSLDTLSGLDETTGKKLWSQSSPFYSDWTGAAYDDGKIFVSPNTTSSYSTTGMYAFDERTGKKLWSSASPGQYSFYPPTAASGMVYASADGVGGTVYAYDESAGALEWDVPVTGGNNISPAVTSAGVFVSYGCPQTYDFRPKTGKTIWHYSGPCTNGEGSTPVVYDGLVFVLGSVVSSGYDGLVLNAKTGKVAGAFNSSRVPAFAHNLGFFISGSTLEAQSIPQMKKAWTVTIATNDDVGFSTPPLVVGNIVYAESADGILYGYDVTNGKQKVKVALPDSIYYQSVSASLAYGDGMLLVPNGPYLLAFTGS